MTDADTGVMPENRPSCKGDLLRLEYINGLPQPFHAVSYGGGEWPVYDIDVQTGLIRLDVCGKLDISHIGNVRIFVDGCGVEHDPDTFYSDWQQ